MRTMANIAVVLAVAGGLAGCGSSPMERSVSGGGVGAAAGVGIAAIAGAPILAGAAVGAAGGAVIGAVTNECQIDLGPRRPKNC
ncbi:hypothetical protein C8N35_109171 [Breoghania corrubedonensis]|uniref:Outer membrane protein with glycine zipper n=1 Tax=Breoghania corrubedonensis TaxID=665038 RepID=A0A2T5V548_9HYPH|nr:hypothetical protein [Breoghania corrubedonensis]PTW58866.1 hypothetical protein C8N35_109171 [Breoghania corrubedonensis]